MPIISSFILPHGALALNPNKYPQYAELIEIYKSANQVADEVYSLKPDLILLMTPHGISTTYSYGIYMNKQASGTAEWENEWKEYKTKVQLSQEKSKELLLFLKEKNKFLFEGIVGYSEDEDIPLRWGEVIPFWFLQQPYKNNTMIPEDFPKCIIMSMPRKRLDQSDTMIEECIEIGNSISELYLNSNLKVVIVVSGDLAHTHNVPTIKMFNNAIPNEGDNADCYDKSIENWAYDPINNEKCLYEAGKVVKTYLSCGYVGICILHGILTHLKKNSREIKGNVLCNLHPTYYGMMVARFVINNI